MSLFDNYWEKKKTEHEIEYCYFVTQVIIWKKKHSKLQHEICFCRKNTQNYNTRYGLDIKPTNKKIYLGLSISPELGLWVLTYVEQKT